MRTPDDTSLSPAGSLDSPLSLSPDLVLRNRVIMASLTRNRAGPETEEETDGSQADALPNKWNLEYYRQRARGGFGLILSEGTLVEPQGTEWPMVAGIYSDEQVEAWKKITDAVHLEKGAIFCQLWHLGRVNHPDQKQQKVFGKPVRAPSNIAARGGKFRQLPGEPGNVAAPALKDPKEVAEAFRKAAENAKKAGFDGVEFHCANGYLPHQFLDKYSNVRTDNYGGSVENRARFAVECLEAILTVWGANRVGIKLNPTAGYNDVGMNEEDTVETFAYLLTQVSRLSLSYVQLVRYLPHMDPALPGDGPEKKGEKRSLCPTLDIEGRLATPFIEGQKKDGRERVTNLFWNGGFGGKKIGGGEGSEWVKAGRADGIVFGTDSITNPDLPFRLFNNVPVQEPGGGNPKTFYQNGEKGKGDGYISSPFSKKFLLHFGEGNVAASVPA